MTLHANQSPTALTRSSLNKTSNRILTGSRLQAYIQVLTRINDFSNPRIQVLTRVNDSPIPIQNIQHSPNIRLLGAQYNGTKESRIKDTTLFLNAKFTPPRHKTKDK